MQDHLARKCLQSQQSYGRQWKGRDNSGRSRYLGKGVTPWRSWNPRDRQPIEAAEAEYLEEQVRASAPQLSSLTTAGQWPDNNGGRMIGKREIGTWIHENKPLNMLKGRPDELERITMTVDSGASETVIPSRWVGDAHSVQRPVPLLQLSPATWM